MQVWREFWSFFVPKEIRKIRRSWATIGEKKNNDFLLVGILQDPMRKGGVSKVLVWKGQKCWFIDFDFI